MVGYAVYTEGNIQMQLIDFSFVIRIEMTWYRIFGALVEVYNLNYFIFSWLRGLWG